MYFMGPPLRNGAYAYMSLCTDASTGELSMRAVGHKVVDIRNSYGVASCVLCSWSLYPTTI